MNLVPLKHLPLLHETPLGTVCIDKATVTLEADRYDEVRLQFKMEPYQAVNITTADCFSFMSITGYEPYNISEVLDSEWIKNLKVTLAGIDETADFLDKARHFIFPLQDCYLEVIAWDLSYKVL